MRNDLLRNRPRSLALVSEMSFWRATLFLTMTVLLQHDLSCTFPKMGVAKAMSTANKKFTQRIVQSTNFPSPPRRPLTPPFPNGPCGGTLLDIAPEETFGVDVNLANINIMGDMVLLPRTIRIWLPPGYEGKSDDDDAANGHPVLYVHDGQNALEDEESWTGASWRLIGALTRLADHRLICTDSGGGSSSSSEKLPIVVLLPSAQGDWLPGVRRRHLEYGDMNFPFSQAHADFVANTVKPLVDNRFYTNSSPEHNFAIGSSLGGQASLHLLLRHPDKFGGAACLSPAFGPAILDFVNSSQGRKILRDGKKVYLDIGGDMDDAKSSDFVRVPPIEILDHLTPVHGWNPGYFWLDTQLQGQVNAMKQALEKGGIDYEYRQYPGGRHNERAWALRIDKPLIHLFSSERHTNSNEEAGKPLRKT